MIELIRWALCVLGLTYLITSSAIFSPVRIFFARNRALRVLLYCAACTGFWVGFGAGFAGLWPFHDAQYVQSATQSAFAAMTLGAIWATWAGNPAYTDEVESKSDESS